MENSSFTHKIDSLRQQIDELLPHTIKDPAAVLPDISQELQSTLEALNVAAERLCSRNEELVVTSENVKVERDHYRDLFEFAPDAYLVTDPEGRIQKANRAAVALFLVREDCLGDKSLVALVADGERQIFQAQLARLNNLEQVQNWEGRMHRLGGEPFYAEIAGSAILDTRGNAVGLRWLVRDISRRKVLEEDLKRYEFIANVSNDFMTLIDKDYVYEAVNDSYCKAHNKTREEIVGTTVIDVWGRERFDTTVKEHLDEGFAGNEVHYQSWFEFATLGLRYFDVSYHPYRANDDGDVTHIAVVSHNITERKQAEETLRKAYEELEVRVEERTAELLETNTVLRKQITERKVAEEKLRESEAHYRNLFNRVPVGLYRTTPEGQIIDANPTLVEMLGYPDDGSILMTDAGDSYVNIEDRQRWQTLVEYEGIMHDFETQWRRQDGTTIWVRENARVIRDTNDRVLYYEGAGIDITEQKQAREMLQASEAKFRTLAEMTAAAIFIYQGTRNRYVNPAMESITGYTQAELLEMNFWDVIHPDYQELVKKHGLERQQGKQVPGEYVLKLLTKVGKERWVDVSLDLVDFEGNPAILGTAFDITERKQIQEATLQVNRKLSALQYVGATIASSLDLDYVLNTFTRELTNLLAVEGCLIFEWDQATQAVSVIAKHFLADFWQKDESSELGNNLADFSLTRQVLVEPRIQQLTIDQVDPDSAESTLMQAFNIKTLLILPMEFQDRVVGLVEVIDNQVERVLTLEDLALAQFLANQAASAIENARLYTQAQQEIVERKRVEQELRQSEARNRALLDAMPDLMFRMNSEGVYLDLHSDKDDDLYVSSQEILGKKVQEVMPSDLADLILYHIDQTLALGIMQVFEYQLPLLHGIQDFEARFVPSGANEVLAIVRNITKRKRAEQEIMRARRLAALGRLTAALAHEINNPLQAIRNHVDLILDFPLEPGESQEYLQVVRHEIERLSDIAQNVLSYAQPKPAPRQSIIVTDQIRDVLVLVSKQLEQKGVHVTTDLRDVPPVLAVPSQLTQIFLNLVINAIEAIPPNGKLNIAAYPEDEQVVVSFTNNGPTIPEEVLPNIFDPFFTTKSEGSGLGLWISHSLIQHHAGSLTVDNVGLHEGVIFIVKLPCIS